MYQRDHEPGHFHARCGADEITVALYAGIVEGQSPQLAAMGSPGATSPWLRKGRATCRTIVEQWSAPGVRRFRVEQMPGEVGQAEEEGGMRPRVDLAV